jgi:hypothetical protein
MAMVSASVAQQITSLKITLSHNGGESTVHEIPATGAAPEDLRNVVTTSLIISKVEVQTSGNVTEVEFAGNMYSVGDTPNPNEMRYLPMENKGNGKWELEANAELIEKDWLTKQKAKTFEFFVVANASTTPIYYNNGGSNYKVSFATYEGAGGDPNDWTVKVFKEQTATLTLSIDGNPKEYTYSGDGDRDPSEQVGELSTLSLNAYSIYLYVNDGVNLTKENVTLQYKVYAEGESGTWNGVACQYFNESIVTNQEKDRQERHISCRSDNLNIQIVGSNSSYQFQPNKTYILEIEYQVVIGDNYTFFMKERSGSLYKFSVKKDTGIENVASQDSSSAPQYNLQGQRVNADHRGFIIRKHKKLYY